MTEKLNLIDSIKKLEEDFYSKNKKCLFMKNSQKKNCAGIIADSLSLNELISNTVYIIKDTNKIYINYSLFKTYATPANYQQIIDRFIDLIIITINAFSSFELHLDLKSLTATAIERYQHVFQLYNDSCIKRGIYYDDKIIDNVYMYYSPSVINILSILIMRFTDKSVKKKLISFSKTDSDKYINDLLR
jgi:hypothetical protein